MVDSAVAYYERATTDYYPDRTIDGFDPMFLPSFLKRLGELYEQRGDTKKAIAAYDRFVTLWRRADPELQPQVEDVRRRLSRLDPERGRR
jgi:hypothetical protein